MASATETPIETPADTLAGITHWPDTVSIYQRLDALVKAPIRPIRKDKLPGVLDWFKSHCERSRQLAADAARLIPGGVQHNLAFNFPHPLAIERAQGAHLWDVDGNQYIDFLQAGGPTILGSNYAPVREKVMALLQECGPVTGLFHPYEARLAELVHKYMPSIEMFRMLGSGTEAVMAAIRLARAFTRRKWIIKIGGAYHGWSDSMVYGMRVPGTGRHDAFGIPRASTTWTQECFPNDLAALHRKLVLNRLRGGTAAVILEPVGPESGTRPVHREYNRQVREMCNKFGALLIFDEVVSGFRLGLGGAQGFLGVKPDLTVLGKCLTGGYPMAGGVGGRKEIIALLAGGIGGSGGKRVTVGGTLSANPLSCAAGCFALEEMERTGAAAAASRAGDRLTQGLDEIIQRLGLPYVAYNQGAIVHLQTSAVLLLSIRNPLKLMREAESRKHMMEEMGAAYTAHGIITLAGSRIYTSLADTDAVIDEALNRFESVMRLV
ncbi:MAG: aminotransferase class III-fold pyridoxal phosphate-dependent enzyme [Holophaga sp.]|nr:aminotransferase class III-fold pyridoxal phosphate-dependent enzyme [Holophaga sp.]